VLTFSRQIRLMGFFRGCKISEPTRFSVDRNARSPFLLKEYNADKPRLIAPVWFSDILRIARGVHYTKIVQTIVMFVSVYMVNKAVGPFTMRKQPSKPMRFVNFSAVTYGDVFCAKISRNVTLLNCFRNSFAPRQNPGFGAIAKNGAEMFCGHDFNAYSKTIRCQA